MTLTPEERQALERCIRAVVDADSPTALRVACKRALVLVWGNLSGRDRDEFVFRLDMSDNHAFVPPKKVSAAAAMDERLITALDRWPDVLAGMTGAEREFADDVNKRRRWKNWKPTPKQEAWILRLWHGHVTAPKESEVME